jgi:hypothetical protein
MNSVLTKATFLGGLACFGLWLMIHNHDSAHFGVIANRCSKSQTKNVDAVGRHGMAKKAMKYILTRNISDVEGSLQGDVDGGCTRDARICHHDNVQISGDARGA